MTKWATLGGVGYNTDWVQAEKCKKLKNGKYQIVLKTGETITFDKQTQGQARLEYHRTKNNDKSGMRIWNFENASITGSKDTASQIILEFCKNLNINTSKNNKKDEIMVQCCENTTVKSDDKDWMHGRIVDHSKTYDNDLDDYIVDFSCGKKAGTYELKTPKIFIKREDVPKCLLKAYDAIAKQNNNKKNIDSEKEVLAFNSKVQNAFNDEKITKEQAVKMGYEPHSTYEYDKYTTKFSGGTLLAIVDKKIDTGNKLLDIGLGVAGAFVGFTGYLAGGVAGMAVDAVRIPYDYATGKIDKQTNFTHWKTSSHWHPEPKEK